MRFENKTLTGEVILDGNIFINCRLHNATIIYTGKKFAFEHLRITGDSTFSLKGPAGLTMDFLTLLAHSQPEAVQDLFDSTAKTLRNPAPRHSPRFSQGSRAKQPATSARAALDRNS